MKSAVIILSAGIEGTTLPPNTITRMDKGIAVFKQQRCDFLLLSGGVQDKISEAVAMEQYAIAHGVPKEKILLEKKSKDTLSQGVFTKWVILQHSIRKCIIVTNDFHTPRTKFIFTKTFGPGFKLSFQHCKGKDYTTRREEVPSFRFARRMFSGLEPGDDTALWQRMKNFIHSSSGSSGISTIFMNCSVSRQWYSIWRRICTHSNEDTIESRINYDISLPRSPLRNHCLALD